MEILKELKDISWQVDEPTYRADPALSYSTLAKFEREGYDKLDTLFEHISTPALTEGSMVDCLITGSQEEFNQQFFIADFPSIGDKELQIATYLFNQFSTNYANISVIPSTYILEAANTYEFQKNWKDETRVRVLTERCDIYYQLKYQAGDRTIVSTETYDKILAMARALKESPATRAYFAADDPYSPVKRYYQLKFKAVFEGIPYRCMADCILVDYEKKIIYPTDLKTSGHAEWHFENSFLTWGYGWQARLYWRLIKATIMNDPYFKDFELKPYRFIVVNKKTLTPLVWEFPLTKALGTLVDDKGNEYRDPFVIGRELQGYLNLRPPVPNGINLDGINTITCLHRKQDPIPPTD